MDLHPVCLRCAHDQKLCHLRGHHMRLEIVDLVRWDPEGDRAVCRPQAQRLQAWVANADILGKCIAVWIHHKPVCLHHKREKEPKEPHWNCPCYLPSCSHCWASAQAMAVISKGACWTSG